MGLDIRFSTHENIVCPRCGEVVATRELDCANSNGRGWYSILESIGYYVPYDQRTEENDWYGKDMVLTPEQAQEVYRFIGRHRDNLYCADEILSLTARAMADGNAVTVNADW